MVSSSSFLSEFETDRVDPEAGPRLMVGAASPLWLVFGGAAAAGATWWWWASRWRQAVNLEALAGSAPEALAPEPLALVTVETIETPFEAVVEPLELESPATLEAVAEVVEVANDVTVETAAETLEAVEETIDAAAAETVEVVEAVAETVPETLEPLVVASVEADELLAVPDAVDVVAEAPLAAVAAEIDDLTRLVGIGPKLAASLSELGVTRFSQIAAWTAEDLKSIDELLNLKGRADRDAWIAQAKRLVGAPEA